MTFIQNYLKYYTLTQLCTALKFSRSTYYKAPLQKEDGGMSLLPFTWILSFEDLLFYDFIELSSSGLGAKWCKPCGRYFVQKTRHKTEYCDRKTENGRTCKQVGPKILFNAELAKPENATLKEYDRIRKQSSKSWRGIGIRRLVHLQASWRKIASNVALIIGSLGITMRIVKFYGSLWDCMSRFWSCWNKEG